MFCNRDPFFHSPFSYSKHNQFGSPKGVRIAPGQCFTHIARNPTNQRIQVKVFDEIHAQEKFTLNVRPADADDSVEEIPEDAIKGPKPCTAEERADFAKMSGSFKSYRMNITIGGSCEQVTGTYQVAEWCAGVNEEGSGKISVTGTFKGSMNGGSLSVTYEQPVSPNKHPARKGSGSCSLGGDGTFSCSGFGCENKFKRQ